MKTTLVLSGMLFAGLALVAGPVPVAQAANITVNTTADVVDANGGSCAGMSISDLPGIDNVTSLREAVCAANGTVGADVITFTDPGGSPDLYTLAIAGTLEDAAATGDLDITEELTITGNGQAETIIQAGTDETNGIDRVFHVRSSAEATFENVTIRHGQIIDVAEDGGGGIYNVDGTVHLTNSTVSGNSANSGGGIANTDTGTVNLTNTIIADQLGGGDCSGAVLVTSNDYNLDSDGSCNLTQPNDKPNNPNANLGPLQLNAPGNTATHALLAGSDAFDTGDCTGGTVTTDQRGVARPQGDACDIGAFEVVVPIPTVSEWGLIIMTVLLLTAGTIVLGRGNGTSWTHPTR